MNTSRACLHLAVVGAGLATLAACSTRGHTAGHSMVTMTPDQMVWQEPASLPPGALVSVIEGVMSEPGPFTARIRVPANYTIPPHWHPGVERVTVLEGSFHMGMGDTIDRASSDRLGPGSFKAIPPRTHHYAWTDEGATIQLHGQGPWDIVYLDPANDPRLQ